MLATHGAKYLSKEPMTISPATGLDQKSYSYNPAVNHSTGFAAPPAPAAAEAEAEAKWNDAGIRISHINDERSYEHERQIKVKNPGWSSAHNLQGTRAELESKPKSK